MLLNIKLIIHINAEDKILDKIYDSILNLGEYLSLGRKEDLVRIDNVRFVEVDEYEVDEDEEDDYEEKLLTDYKMKMPIYVPKEKEYDLSGINYRLNNYYTDKRNNWIKINTLYVEKGNQISEGIILLDEFYDLVCFNNI